MSKYRLLLALCLIAFVGLKVDAMVDKSLVLYLPFDEGKGTDVKDTSGNGNDGTIHGDVKWIGGAAGNALEFGGNIGQYVEVPDSDSLRYGKDPFTYMAWIKAYKLKTVESQTIISKRVPEAGNGKETATLFIEKQKDCLSVEFRDNIQAMFLFVAENAVVKESTWHHVAWVKDDTELRFYVDGNMMQKTNHSMKGTVNGTQSLYVGVHHYGATWNAPFNGAIDNVAVFRRALNDDSIRQSMTSIFPVQSLGKLASTWGEIKK